MKVFMYVVAESKNPDRVTCKVPYEVNSNKIFFGPCKKPLRRNLYSRYLKESDLGHVVANDDLYVVGVNGANPEKIRKIVWVGKIIELLTFEEAWNTLSPMKEFSRMIEDSMSPLHLRPIYDQGRKKPFKGYELRSNMHSENNVWVMDVLEKRHHPGVEIRNKKLLLRDLSERRHVFVRDCCFLCKNTFFAKGKGIDIDEEILKILIRAQPSARHVDDYAIFGRKKGRADGLRGSYREIAGPNAENLVDTVLNRK